MGGGYHSATNQTRNSTCQENRKKEGKRRIRRRRKIFFGVSFLSFSVFSFPSSFFFSLFFFSYFLFCYQTDAELRTRPSENLFFLQNPQDIPKSSSFQSRLPRSLFSLFYYQNATCLHNAASFHSEQQHTR